jgi:hypothetical protein
MEEIEQTLLRQHTISDAAVVTRRRSTAGGEELDLVAFVVVRPQENEVPRDEQAGRQDASREGMELLLLDELRARLPSYMVPTRLVVMNRIPLNASGKVDRRLLEIQAQELPIEAAGGKRLDQVPPKNYLERAICEEFAGVLGLDTVHATDNFFELGGHSLMATRCAARLGRRLNSSISVRDIFDHPAPVQLAAQAQRLLRPHDGIPKHDAGASVPLSFAQARLFFLDHLGSGTWYLLPLTVLIRGSLDVAALEQALHSVEQRHDILRTTFQVEGKALDQMPEEHGQRGMPATQIVHPFCPRPLAVTKVSAETDELQAMLRKEQTQPFDLKREAGWRVRLFQLAPDADVALDATANFAHEQRTPASPDYVLSIVMHHAITDGWSNSVFCHELALFYSAARRNLDFSSQVKPLPIQYRDFAAWQQHPSKDVEYKEQLEFWISQLRGSQPAEPPVDYRRPATPSGKAGVIDIQLDESLYQQFGQFQGMTPFMIIFTAFRAAHYRLTAMEDATIASPVANRNRQELEDIIGFFVNTLCIRTTADDDTSFQDLLQQVRQATVAAYQNQDVPFQQLVSTLRPNLHDMSRNPLAQILLAVHSQHNSGDVELEGVSTSMMRPLAPTTRLDLEIRLYQSGKGFDGYALSATDIYNRETVQAPVDVFLQILERVQSTPDIPILQIPLNESSINSQDRRLDSEHPEDSSETLDQSVTNVFIQQASINPYVVAVENDTTHKLDLRSARPELRPARCMASTNGFSQRGICGSLGLPFLPDGHCISGHTQGEPVLCTLGPEPSAGTHRVFDFPFAPSAGPCRRRRPLSFPAVDQCQICAAFGSGRPIATHVFGADATTIQTQRFISGDLDVHEWYHGSA